MTPQEELDAALAEVAAAKAELAAARAEVADSDAAASKPGRAKKVQKPKPTARPLVHKSDLRRGCYGLGQRFTSDGKVRVDMTPVVTKEYDPMSRPVDNSYVGHECLLVFDVRNGFMESDSWKRCKCAACTEIRRG